MPTPLRPPEKGFCLARSAGQSYRAPSTASGLTRSRPVSTRLQTPRLVQRLELGPRKRARVGHGRLGRCAVNFGKRRRPYDILKTTRSAQSATALPRALLTLAPHSPRAPTARSDRPPTSQQVPRSEPNVDKTETDVSAFFRGVAISLRIARARTSCSGAPACWPSPPPPTLTSPSPGARPRRRSSCATSRRSRSSGRRSAPIRPFVD